MSRRGRIELRGARVLLTGASGGIGRAIARELSAAGAELVLTGRRAEALEGLAAELGGRAEVLVADLADRAAVDRLIADAGAVDVLVANAALPASGPIDDFTVEQIDRALDVNLRAPILMARALSEGMAARGGGHIVFISSLGGKVTTPRSGLYSATKFGVRGFALALRQDLRERNVGVSSVFPAFIGDAGMWADAQVRMTRGAGTRPASAVGRAVRRAIERDRAEIDVTTPFFRISGIAGTVAPQLVAAINRRMGEAERISQGLTDAQRHMR